MGVQCLTGKAKAIRTLSSSALWALSGGFAAVRVLGGLKALDGEFRLPSHHCRGGEPESLPSPELSPSSRCGRMEPRGKDAGGSSPSLIAGSSRCPVWLDQSRC